MPAELLIGDPAPDFHALALGPGLPAEGGSVSLASLRGRRAALCFFPHNDDPGTATQVCALRDAWGELGARAALLGVNGDPLEAHRRFIEGFALPFTLVSDADHALARAFGVWLGDGGGGDVEGGDSSRRATFILNPEGRVEAIFHDPHPAAHARWLLEALPTS